MAENSTSIPIQIYLSYRCQHEDSIAARDILEQCCQDAGFKLVYDESGTRQGDSLIKFMDDLVSARIIVLFLIPDYFQSAWCMYELIHLYKMTSQDLHQMILPFKLSDEVSLKVKHQAKRFWESDDDTAKDERDFLAEQLELKGDEEQIKQLIWQRIEAAWDKIIQPNLEAQQDPLQPSNCDNVLREEIAYISILLQAAIDKFHQNFIDDLSIALKNLFKQDKLCYALQAELQVTTEDNLADELLKSLDVFSAITTIIRVVKNLQRDPSANNVWEEWYVHGEDLCALLLLNSVDKTWWYQNQLRFWREYRQGNHQSYVLEKSAYSEVVISRSLSQPPGKQVIIKQPNLEFNQESRAVTPCNDFNNTVLFDATDRAQDEQLLIAMFNDLIGRQPDEKEKNASNDQQFPALLKPIAEKAKVRAATRLAPVYYLVNDQFMASLQERPWYPAACQLWKGNLMFVVCETNPPPHHQSPSTEDQSLLMSALADYKALAHDKKHHS